MVAEPCFHGWDTSAHAILPGGAYWGTGWVFQTAGEQRSMSSGKTALTKPPSMKPLWPFSDSLDNLLLRWAIQVRNITGVVRDVARPSCGATALGLECCFGRDRNAFSKSSILDSCIRTLNDGVDYIDIHSAKSFRRLRNREKLPMRRCMLILRSCFYWYLACQMVFSETFSGRCSGIDVTLRKAES